MSRATRPRLPIPVNNANWENPNFMGPHDLKVPLIYRLANGQLALPSRVKKVQNDDANWSKNFPQAFLDEDLHRLVMPSHDGAPTYQGNVVPQDKEITEEVKQNLQIVPPAVITPFRLPPTFAVTYGLVSWWQLGELNTGPRFDSFGGNNLANINGATSGAGVSSTTGPATVFHAASSQRLQIPSNSSLQTGHVDFWVMAWFKTVASSFQGIYDKGASGTTGEMTIRIYSGGQLEVVPGGSAYDFVTPFLVNDGQWHLVLFVADAVNNLGHTYFDSSLVDTHPLGLVTKNNLNLTIGSHNDPVFYFDGSLGPIAFGKQPPAGIDALRASLNTTLWNSGLGRKFPF